MYTDHRPDVLRALAAHYGPLSNSKLLRGDDFPHHGVKMPQKRAFPIGLLDMKEANFGIYVRLPLFLYLSE